MAARGFHEARRECRRAGRRPHSWKSKSRSARSWAFEIYGPSKRFSMDRNQPPGRRWRKITMNCRYQLPTAVRTPSTRCMVQHNIYLRQWAHETFNDSAIPLTNRLGVESMLVRIRITSVRRRIGTVPLAKSLSTKPNRREQPRHRLDSRITLSWRDSTWHEKRFDCRAMNMDSLGAMVVSKTALEVGSVVYIHVKALQRAGTATVRHCTRRRFKFLIGLEFAGPLVALEERGQ